MDAETSVKDLLANVDSYVGSARAMLTAVQPGEELLEATPVNVVDEPPLPISSEEILQVRRAQAGPGGCEPA